MATTRATPHPASGATTTDLEKASLEDVLKQLGVQATSGLATADAKSRLSEYGPNAIAERQQSLLRKALGYFTGPIAYMIEAAAAVSAIFGHWDDFAIIAALLLFNAGLGFWQDSKAANALAALKKGLAPNATVHARRVLADRRRLDVVPGDIVKVRLGDIVPADLRLMGDGFAVDRPGGAHRRIGAREQEGR